MKYITRVDRDRHHCWKVSVGPSYKDWSVCKSFFDQKLGGKKKALAEAIKYRDYHAKRLQKKLGRPDAKGYSECWDRRGNYYYLRIYTSFAVNGVKKKKTFSVMQHGYDEAIRLALKWRKEQIEKSYE